MFIDKNGLNDIVDLINYDIRATIDDYYERLNKNKKWDGSNHRLMYVIPVIEMLIKNNHQLYYTDFDIHHIPTAKRLHLFDGYVEEYRERADIIKNESVLNKWFK